VGDESLPGWPVSFDGIIESIVTTEGPNGLWNVAALGLHAKSRTGDGESAVERDETAPEVHARTWGRTRTWRNFRERELGYVQFTTDPVLFVKAALEVYEVETPVLPEAYAWVAVTPVKLDSGTQGETPWVDWRLDPVEAETVERVVPTFNRGYGAVVEATVAASRLDVPSYETEQLWERIEYFESVAKRCGGERERKAFERLLAAIETER